MGRYPRGQRAALVLKQAVRIPSATPPPGTEHEPELDILQAVHGASSTIVICTESAIRNVIEIARIPAPGYRRDRVRLVCRSEQV